MSSLEPLRKILIACAVWLAALVVVSPAGAQGNDIAAGYRHTCALAGSGTVACWGHGEYGQLDGGIRGISATPITVHDITNAVGVAAGGNQSCALLATGQVQCWGQNTWQQLGDGKVLDSAVPVVVKNLHDATSVTVGAMHACATRAIGTVVCWGDGTNGRLGDGRGRSSKTPITVSGITDATTVEASGSITCAIVSGGRVRCWGATFNGELGNGESRGPDDGRAFAPVEVAGITDAAELSVSPGHVCAVRRSGQLSCWGARTKYTIRKRHDVNRPATVPEIDDAASVVARRNSYCVVRRSGGVLCNQWNDGAGTPWGYGLTPIPGVGDADGVARTTTHPDTICIHTVREISGCLGDAAAPQSGHPGFSALASEPVEVPALQGASTIEFGVGTPCAVFADKTVKCWGWGLYGQLGDGRSTPDAGLPRHVAGMSDAVDVSGTERQTCAADAAGTLRCWGSFPSTSSLRTPTVVSTGAAVRRVYSGGACLLTDVQEVVCQSASGAYTVRPFARPVAQFADTAISGHSCAVYPAGDVACRGAGSYGQLGYGGKTSNRDTIAVKNLTDATQVAVGTTHSCALRATKRVVCWGKGASGQMGNGKTADALTPTAVTGLTDAIALAAGGDVTCAIRTGGAIVCWGAGGRGALGTGGLTNALTPTPVSGIAGATRLWLGDGIGCASIADGSVRCWGDGSQPNGFAPIQGRLGDGYASTGGHHPLIPEFSPVTR